MTSSATAADSPKEGNKGPTGPKSTLSILKRLRVGSKGFLDFYRKVWNQFTGVNNWNSVAILDWPMFFIFQTVCIIVGSIFLNDCPAEPMLPIYLIVQGVAGSSIQIINQIAGSLLKDDKIIWKFVKDLCIIIMFIFMFCWFITGCVWVFSMPLPNMTRFPDTVTPILPGLLNDLLISYSTSLPTDEFASINSTVVSLFSPEKHCAFPVYGLAVWIVFSLLVSYVGYSIIVHMTAFLLFLLPEVDNVLNMELWQMNNV